MKRTVLVLIVLIAVSAWASAQAEYSSEALSDMGLEENEIAAIQRIVAESGRESARLRAELNIKKAELARLLLDDEPNMRAVERNLTESAQLEVQLRMLEIERELAIREVVGTDRWTRLVRHLREQIERSRAGAQNRVGDAISDLITRLGAAQDVLEARQSQILEQLRRAGDRETAQRLGRQLLEIQEEYEELIEELRDRL